MIQIRHENLRFSFPEIHEDAVFDIDFQRTLRIPDDDTVHSLPPGLGRFPLRNIDRFPKTAPAAWLERGGAMLPMFQSEALWLNFHAHAGYPCLVMIAAGGINAVTGETHTGKPFPDPQNYIVAPTQPWLDGYCVSKGEIRQFVAAPLGKGYTAEEQLTGDAKHGGLQFTVVPMKAREWEKICSRRRERDGMESVLMKCYVSGPEMGLAAGGRMRQHIYDDEYGFDKWDFGAASHCFLHIANSLSWRAITGEAPPTMPPTAQQYTEYGLPWFTWYDGDRAALDGAQKLAGLKSTAQLDAENSEKLLPENEPVGPVTPVHLKDDRVRESQL